MFLEKLFSLSTMWPFLNLKKKKKKHTFMSYDKIKINRREFGRTEC